MTDREEIERLRDRCDALELKVANLRLVFRAARKICMRKYLNRTEIADKFTVTDIDLFKELERAVGIVTDADRQDNVSKF